jgi:membrane protein DedA with SNARE-associated domain
MIEQDKPGGVAGWATGLMETLGAPGAGLAIALENLFPPLPSELILPLVGFTAGQGQISLAAAIVWTTIGSLTGALVLYGLGALLGRDRMRAVARRVPLVEASDIDRSEAWFARHGSKAVFFGRMVPVFRSFVSIPAGVERMPVASFVLLTTLGSAIWNTAFILAGYLLGENWHVVETYASWFQWLVIGTVVVAVGWFVTRRVQKIRSRGT